MTYTNNHLINRNGVTFTIAATLAWPPGTDPAYGEIIDYQIYHKNDDITEFISDDHQHDLLESIMDHLIQSAIEEGH